jgi:transcriptional regulator with XRE-family HTH domain
MQDSVCFSITLRELLVILSCSDESKVVKASPTLTQMDPGPLARSAGAKLKQLRVQIGLTLREVEAGTRKLAQEKHNPDFFISRGWLNNVENGSYTPSIYKLYSLSVIYQDSWSNVLSFFGLRVSDIGRDQSLFGLPNTRLVPNAGESDGEAIALPLQSREELQLDRTNLLSRLAQIWGEVPIRLIQHLNLTKCVYGYIGLKDLTMYPLIRPGSIVQIDGSQRKISPDKWRTEFERPIYFVELRNGYVCSWCEVKENHLLAIPHPNSPCEIRRFPYPQEAEIVGRVTGLAMRIMEADVL